MIKLVESNPKIRTTESIQAKEGVLTSRRNQSRLGSMDPYSARLKEERLPSGAGAAEIIDGVVELVQCVPELVQPRPGADATPLG